MIGERYTRQTMLPEIGAHGQKLLRASSVLVIGAGGLGCPVLMYLAAAGVGKIDIVDGDVVSLSNLNRQVLYGSSDVGRPKALCAKTMVNKINDEIVCSADQATLNEGNAAEYIKNHDALLFCLDTVSARKVCNKAAVNLGIPYIEGSVNGFDGMVTTVVPHITPCYECLFGGVDDLGTTVPVLGPVVGIIGTFMATAAIHLLLGMKCASKGHLFVIDGKGFSTSLIPVLRNDSCPVCGD